MRGGGEREVEERGGRFANCHWSSYEVRKYYIKLQVHLIPLQSATKVPSFTREAAASTIN